MDFRAFLLLLSRVLAVFTLSYIFIPKMKIILAKPDE